MTGGTAVKLPVSLCSDPGIPDNGVYSGRPIDGFLPGSQVNFQCDTGYQIDGDDIIVCQKDGKWNKERPRCVRGKHGC